MEEFNHLQKGRAVMVSVTDKEVTKRRARAEGKIFVSPYVFEHIQSGDLKKGDALSAARLAGIMGTKRTSDLIPLCHPLMLTGAKVDFELNEAEHSVKAVCTAEIEARTGVEMEALTGVMTALLTIYDMCKSADQSMEIGEVHLVEKSGGKSGDYVRGRKT